MPAFTVKPDSRSLVHPDLRSRTNLFSKYFSHADVCPIFPHLIGAVLVALAAAAGTQAQTLNVRFAVTSTSPARIQVNV